MFSMGTKMHRIGPGNGKQAFEMDRNMCLEGDLRERTYKLGCKFLKWAEQWEDRRARVDFIYVCCFLLRDRVEY